VAVARALVKEPQLLLLDEPLSNLDASLRLTMRTEIKTLQRKLGVTTILVTHDQVEAMTMADRIVCMKAGRIEQTGRPEELYLEPRTRFIASFIGSPPINIVEGSIEGGAFRSGGIRIPCRCNGHSGEVLLGVRPEHVAIASADAGGNAGGDGAAGTGTAAAGSIGPDSSAGAITGRMIQIEPLGREHLYCVETSLGLITALESGTTPRYRLDDAVRLVFHPEKALFFDARTEALIRDARLLPADAHPGDA